MEQLLKMGWNIKVAEDNKPTSLELRELLGTATAYLSNIDENARLTRILCPLGNIEIEIKDQVPFIMFIRLPSYLTQSLKELANKAKIQVEEKEHHPKDANGNSHLHKSKGKKESQD